jgi:hypothetical protein
MDMEEHIQISLDCARICEETMLHCLKTGGDHADIQHISILTDCAKICKLNADFMIRKSSVAQEIMDACAKICDKCAESCESLQDDKMDICVKACRDCAAACRAASST